jgi:membrane fusion protein (multidrug efflux system)
MVLADGSAYPQKGKFYVADSKVDEKTGAIRVAGIFPNHGNFLRPGQYARVRAVTSKKDGALLIPQRAINELQGRFQVAVVNPDNKVEIRTVSVGERIGNMTIINQGLSVGEMVVAEGIQKVKSGSIVNAKPFTPPPPSVKP